jgi:hypothetical protein
VDEYEVTTYLVDKLPVLRIYRYIALFVIKYMPVLKWLCMTTDKGARGVYYTRYDRLHTDKLFDWFVDQTRNGTVFNPTVDRYLMGMERESYIRTYSDTTIHWEMRMADVMVSPTLLAAWMSLMRGLTLWAIDFARNEYEFPVSEQDWADSYNKMESYGNSHGMWHLNRDWVESKWAEVKGYLFKYMKIANSIGALDVLDKVIEKPIPQFLRENNWTRYYDPFQLEGAYFGTQSTPANAEMREVYLKLIKQMAVPIADTLAEFHNNVATVLGIKASQAQNLYSVLRKDKVPLEFHAGRLLYMGD